jgi:3-oxoacyl-[acyl-carrier protein] reductase
MAGSINKRRLRLERNYSINKKDTAEPMRLKGKVALVTGGTRGIGNATVHKLAAEGAAVGFTYLKNSELAGELERLIAAGGGKVFGMKADIRSAADIHAFVERAASEFGGIDIVINNAHHAYQAKLFEEASWEDFQREFAQLVGGPFNLIQAALPYLKKRGGGSIINVGSTMARAPRLKHSFYVAAKRALSGLTEALALELGPYGVRVNLLTPGPLNTEHNASHSAEKMKKFGEETPLRGRIGTPEEVADALVLLTLDEARLITGADVLASGGFSIA